MIQWKWEIMTKDSDEKISLFYKRLMQCSFMVGWRDWHDLRTVSLAMFPVDLHSDRFKNIWLLGKAFQIVVASNILYKEVANLRVLGAKWRKVMLGYLHGKKGENMHEVWNWWRNENMNYLGGSKKRKQANRPEWG